MNWERKPLEEVTLKITAGGTPSRKEGEYWNEGTIPWVKISDMKSKFVSKTDEAITESGLKNSSAKIFPKGTILYSIFASLGEVSILKIDATTNQAIAGITPNEEIVDREYLYYCLKAEKNNILQKKTHGVQDNLNLKIIRNHTIPIPSLEVQRKIVAMLHRTDQLVNNRKYANSQTLTLMDSIFHQWFFSDDVEKLKLRKLCTLISSGSTPKGGSKNYMTEGEILFIRSQNVLMNKFSQHEKLFISKEIHNRMKRTWVKNNDVLLNITGASIGRTAIYRGEDDKANVNQHVCILRLKENSPISAEYLNYFLSSNQMQTHIMERNAGATRQALNFSQIGNFIVPVPPKELEEKFSVLVKEFQSIKREQLKSTMEIDELNNALIQKAFKGELTS